MNDPTINALVQEGIAAYNAGNAERAYELLSQALQREPNHEVGWLWMSAVVKEPAERRYCLERVVAINPTHSAAQRGIARFPTDLVARNPLPVPIPLCTHPGCSQPVQRVGHTLCRDHWIQQAPKSSAPTAPPVQPKGKGVATTIETLPPPSALPLCSHPGCTQPVQRAGHTLCRDHWVPPPRTPSTPPKPTVAPGGTGQKQAIRKHPPAKHRTTDGHLVRSKAEMLIDNWLYTSGIVHAYERKLPIEEEVYCDFYLPTGKVYIEYWGFENDAAYNARRKVKTEIYQRYSFNLVELTDEQIRNLDDFLPRLLLKYGIEVR